VVALVMVSVVAARLVDLGRVLTPSTELEATAATGRRFGTAVWSRSAPRGDQPCGGSLAAASPRGLAVPVVCGGCRCGGETFLQPVNEILERL